MNISELVSLLKEIETQHGDIPVAYCGEMYDLELTHAFVMQEGLGTSEGDKTKHLVVW